MTQPKLAANIAYLFIDLPLIDRFMAARDAGFQAVDISDIMRFPLADVVAGMRQSGLPLLQTTAAVGSHDRQGPGMAALPGREDEFRAGCQAVLPYVEATGLRWMHFNSGIPGPNESFERCHAAYLANLRMALELFPRHGVRVLVEPINTTDLPGYFLGDLALARRVIAEIGHPDLRLLFDVYHLAMAGLDPVQAFRDSRHDIGHVQFADCPGRHEPGTGSIDFAALLAAADATGYEGWFSAEYLPQGDTAAGLGWVNDLLGRRG